MVPWSAATARGCPLNHLLEPPRLARLRDRARLVWPPGPYALASVTARACEAVAAGAGPRALSCFTVLDGELGVRRTTAAVTVELGPAGVTRILEPALTVQERVQLETALQADEDQQSAVARSRLPKARTARLGGSGAGRAPASGRRGLAAPSGGGRAQRASAGAARGEGAPASGRRGLGAQPHLEEAAHGAPRRERRGAKGPPQADAGGSGRSPV